MSIQFLAQIYSHTLVALVPDLNNPSRTHLLWLELSVFLGHLAGDLVIMTFNGWCFGDSYRGSRQARHEPVLRLPTLGGYLDRFRRISTKIATKGLSPDIFR
jgi:hypothetical protein